MIMKFTGVRVDNVTDSITVDTNKGFNITHTDSYTTVESEDKKVVFKRDAVITEVVAQRKVDIEIKNVRLDKSGDDVYVTIRGKASARVQALRQTTDIEEPILIRDTPYNRVTDPEIARKFYDDVIRALRKKACKQMGLEEDDIE